MTKKDQKALYELFTTIQADDGERIVYSKKYLYAERGTYERYMYETVSNIAHASDLTHDFSYEIMSRACDVLAELDDPNDEDAISEAADAIVPVYTHDLMQIYASNSWAVDEACEEYGTSGDSTNRAQMAWYVLIDRVARDIQAALTDY